VNIVLLIKNDFYESRFLNVDTLAKLLFSI